MGQVMWMWQDVHESDDDHNADLASARLTMPLLNAMGMIVTLFCVA